MGGIAQKRRRSCVTGRRIDRARVKRGLRRKRESISAACGCGPRRIYFANRSPRVYHGQPRYSPIVREGFGVPAIRCRFSYAAAIALWCRRPSLMFCSAFEDKPPESGEQWWAHALARRPILTRTQSLLDDPIRKFRRWWKTRRT